MAKEQLTPGSDPDNVQFVVVEDYTYPDNEGFTDDEIYRLLNGLSLNLTAAVTAAGGRKGNPKSLKEYWTKGEGLAKWVDAAHPWTTLYRHLKKYMSNDMAKRTASQWYHDVKGHWPNEKTGK